MAFIRICSQFDWMAELIGGRQGRETDDGDEYDDGASLDSSVGDEQNDQLLDQMTSSFMQTSVHAKGRARGDLVFEGSFEGGNICKAVRVDESEYEISLRGDSMNPKYRLWFHFTVSNVISGQQMVFSIVNFSKARSLYRHGMAPVVRSSLRPHWHRLPSQHTYWYKSKRHGRYVMSFAFIFDEENDTYEFAYSYPFTYTTLLFELGYLDFMANGALRRETLCRTPQQRKVEVITISSPLLPSPMDLKGSGAGPSTASPPTLPTVRSISSPGIGPKTYKQRPVVFITSRVHPGETPASFVTQGLLSFLLGSDPRAVMLRSQVTFVTIPMLNPDGCALGNYRTEAGGLDMNRSWLQPSSQSLPALHHTLKLLQAYSSHPLYSLDLYIDIHAHSTSKQSFMFCNASSKGGVPVKGTQADAEASCSGLDAVLRLPRLLSARLPPHCFSLEKCRAEEGQVKSGCARRVAGNLLNSPHSSSPFGSHCYTFEISFHHTGGEGVSVSMPGERSSVEAINTVEGYLDMGRNLALSILDYYNLSTLPAQASASSAKIRSPSPLSRDAGSLTKRAGSLGGVLPPKLPLAPRSTSISQSSRATLKTSRTQSPAPPKRPPTSDMLAFAAETAAANAGLKERQSGHLKEAVDQEVSPTDGTVLKNHRQEKSRSFTNLLY